MEQFGFEIVLAVVLAGAVLWFRRSQEPRRPLTGPEVEKFLATVEATFPIPDADLKARALVRLRQFAQNDDGRDLYMLNLLRFHERMAQGPAPASGFNGTTAEANALYEANAMPVALKLGAFPIFAGNVSEPNAIGGDDPAEDNWSRVIVMHYPSRRHFFRLLTDPVYLRKADYKTYAMHIALVPVRRELVMPDFRTLAVFGAVIVFLAAALVHALLRAGL